VSGPKKRRGRGRPQAKRDITVVPVRRDEIDVRRLARALLALAQAEADRERAEKEATDEAS
jgi:hypothetical protein